MSRITANFLLLLAGLVWGGGFVAQSTAMESIGPFLFLSVRFFLAALAVLLFALWESQKLGEEFPIHRSDWPSIMGVGVVFFLAMMAQQVGLLSTTVTNAGILTGLYVVLVPLIAFGLLGERQPTIIWPAAAIAFLGIWLLGGGGIGALTWGDWLVLIGAFFAALHMIAVGRSVQSLHRPGAVACAQFAVAGILSFCGFFIARLFDWSYEPTFSGSALLDAAPEVLYAALLAGALAFTLMAVCQQYTSAADAAILLSSETLFAALGGAIFLHERLTPIGYLGCFLLFASIVTVSIASAKVDPASQHP